MSNEALHTVAADGAAPSIAATLDLSRSRKRRIVDEFLSDSAHFPAANILLELLLEGPARYLVAVDFYAIVLAALVQAICAGSLPTIRPAGRLALGLVGPAIYTGIELAAEGPGILAAPHHIAYWLFALALGSLRAAKANSMGTTRAVCQIAEAVVRAGIFLVMYAIFEALNTKTNLSLGKFLAERDHVFVAAVIPALGLLAGAANVAVDGYQDRLVRLAARLRAISTWSWGAGLVAATVADPARLELSRLRRTVLFMDIRSFTAWAESATPEAVVAMLNSYFTAAEAVWARAPVVRAKHTGDELMLILPADIPAVALARELGRAVAGVLAPHGLDIGIGIHAGPVVEGLMGSDSIRAYDAIGDTVNVASRLCAAAAPGEIMATASVADAPRAASSAEQRSLPLKGKSAEIPVGVWRV